MMSNQMMVSSQVFLEVFSEVDFSSETLRLRSHNNRRIYLDQGSRRPEKLSINEGEEI